MLEINESEFQDTITEGITVIDFYAPWCGPCKALSKELEQLSNECVAKVNIEENYALAEKYEIHHLPTLVFFKDGVEVHRSVGLIGHEHIKSKINEIRSH